jgi:hypothetical protein
MGRILALMAASAIVVCFGLALWLSWDAFDGSRPAEAQSQNETCPGPSHTILNENGGDVSTNAQGHAIYGPFTTRANSFQVTIDASSSQGPSPWASSRSARPRTR